MLETKPQSMLNDPTEFLMGRFRKMGNLGHFLTPTSASWLTGATRFAVSYRENIVSIFDVESGNEVEDFSFGGHDNLLATDDFSITGTNGTGNGGGNGRSTRQELAMLS